MKVQLRKEKGHWKLIDNQQNFLHNLNIKLKIEHENDICKLTTKNIIKYGGKSLLHQYNHNLSHLIQKFYPNFSHIVQENKPKNYWRNIENQRNFFDYLFKKLNLNHFSDWNELGWKKVIENGGGAVLNIYGGSLSRALSSLYPSLSHLIIRKRKDYQHPSLRSQYNGALELDIFIPSLNLAMEYQGEQHFDDKIEVGFSTSQFYHFVDNFKLKECEKNLIYLISIPFWWDRSPSSILSLLPPSMQIN